MNQCLGLKNTPQCSHLATHRISLQVDKRSGNLTMCHAQATKLGRRRDWKWRPRKPQSTQRPPPLNSIAAPVRPPRPSLPPLPPAHSSLARCPIPYLVHHNQVYDSVFPQGRRRLLDRGYSSRQKPEKAEFKSEGEIHRKCSRGKENINDKKAGSCKEYPRMEKDGPGAAILNNRFKKGRTESGIIYFSSKREWTISKESKKKK
jgi:hypothetical protein